MKKISLISVPRFQQGLRYDDLFLLTGLIYILQQRKNFLHVIPEMNVFVCFVVQSLAYEILHYYEPNSNITVFDNIENIRKKAIILYSKNIELFGLNIND